MLPRHARRTLTHHELVLAADERPYSREFLDAEYAAIAGVDAVADDGLLARVGDDLHIPEEPRVLFVDLDGAHASAPREVIHRDALRGIAAHLDARALILV